MMIQVVCMNLKYRESHKVIGIVLAGGKGERLFPLTRERPKPGMPFGGKYRIIDFVISNFFNSGIRQLYVLTQYHSYQLNKYIRNTWDRLMGWDECCEAISPESNCDGEEWFRGTADAVAHYLKALEESDADLIAIFSGDHIYKMDIRQMVDYHRAMHSDLTISTIPVPPEQASRFGICSVDEEGRITAFSEKPDQPAIDPRSGRCIASMGNYIFSRRKLVEALREGIARYENLDFGKHIIPLMLANGEQLTAYDFEQNRIKEMTPSETGYWMDVGTLDAYYAANMDLVAVSPQLNLYNGQWPVMTSPCHYPPAKTVFDDGARCGHAIDSCICGCSIISGGKVVRSIIGQACKINSFSLIEESILFENVNIGRNVRIRRAIIDEGVSIPDGSVIGYDAEADRRNGYTITDNGVVVVAAA